MQRGLLTMSTDELNRLSIVQKIVDEHITQVVAAQQLVEQADRIAAASLLDYLGMGNVEAYYLPAPLISGLLAPPIQTP